VIMMFCIRGATILTPTEEINNGVLLTEGRQIAAIGPSDALPCPPDAQIIEARGLYLVPGFIDLQVNGAFGCDFTADPSAIWQVAAGLPCYGVTSFLPTIVTSPLETVSQAQDALARAPGSGAVCAEPLGLHIEGPFLNPKKKGAHNPLHLCAPSLQAIKNWSPTHGIRLVTLAPELPGALDVIRTLTERGTVVSAGHSAATYAEARAAFAAGVQYGTHIFNAMPPLEHREPGLVGALLEEPGVTLGLIVDGVHVHPAMVSLVWKVAGRQRLNLVSDCMEALGMPPGQYEIGNLTVSVDGTTARLLDGTLAGSILSLDRALRNLLKFTGCPLREAISSLTTTPARLLGLSGQKGRLAPGLAADIVLLSPDLSVVMTTIAGRVAYQAQSSHKNGGHLLELNLSESRSTALRR
jgi:N-acetylglucosamine-6-phosphate deacetylase